MVTNAAPIEVTVVTKTRSVTIAFALPNLLLLSTKIVLFIKNQINTRRPMKDTLIGMVQDGKTWPTRDMHLAVTLIAKGYKPIDGGIYARDGILYYEFLLGMTFALKKRLFHLCMIPYTNRKSFQSMARDWGSWIEREQ